MLARAALTVDDWNRLNRLLEQGLAVPVTARAAWLADLPAESAHLRGLLTQLLADSESTGFITDIAPPTTVARLAAEALSSMRREQVGDRIGPWQLERLLAEGGMGTVWIAQRADGVMRRTAALKLPRAEWVDRGLTERIARERAILARLQHPHIAVLYDAGVTGEGRPYLALEYVEGQPIDAYCRGRAGGLPEVIRLMVQVVRAVAYAHSRLVIHRDLKPSNVLVMADGTPKLLDFGISKLMEDDTPTVDETALTRLGGRALTPAYAAPEQLLGQPVTVAADVYALGVMLFELTTGARLYRATRPATLEEEILRGDVRRPSEVAADKGRAKALRGDLDAIVLTALKRTPEARYDSAAALADDLERYLAGKPVRAQPDSRAYRLHKFVTRNRVPVAAGSAVLLALAAGLGIALWQAEQARQQAAEARNQAERATALNTFVLSLIQQFDPRASQASKAADLALLAGIEKRVDTEFKGSADQLLQLRTAVGDAYRERGQHLAARRVYRRAINEAKAELPSNHLGLMKARVGVAFMEVADEEALIDLDPTIEKLRTAGPKATEILIDALVTRVLVAVHIDRRPGWTSDSLYTDAREAYDLATRHLETDSTRRLRAAQVLAQGLFVQVGRSRADGETMREAFEVLESALDRAKSDPAIKQGNTELLLAESHLGVLECGYRSFDDGRLRLWNAIEMARRHHSEDSFALSVAWERLGRCFIRRGDAEGVWWLVRAYDIVSMREEPSPFVLARIASSVARLHCDAMRAKQCADFTQKALTHAAALPAGEIKSQILAFMRPPQVQALMLQGKTEQAEAKATEFLFEPRCCEAVLNSMRGRAMRWNGRFEDSIRSENVALSVARQKSAEGFVVWILVGRSLAELDLGDPVKALSTIEEAMPKISREPGHDSDWGMAHLAHGRALLANGRAAEALEPLRKSYGYWLGHDPKSVWAAEAEYWFGRAYIAGGDVKRGRWMVAEAKRALATSPFKLHRALATPTAH